MNRRSFLGRTFGAIAAACAAPFLPSSPALKPLGLQFHPDAFAFVSPPITRLDVLYGFASLGPPHMAIRVWDEDRASGSFLNYIAAERDALRESVTL